MNSLKPILSGMIFFCLCSPAYAGQDYSGYHLVGLCKQQDTQLCEGYLLGILDALQSKEICLCPGKLCGMASIDTKKLAMGFSEWSLIHNGEGSAMRNFAQQFLKEAFSCQRDANIRWIK